MPRSTATAKWIRRLGLAYGVFMVFTFLRLAFASAGITENLNGKVQWEGVAVNGLATLFVLLPYRRIARSSRGDLVFAAFLLFISAYSLFAAAQSFRAIKGHLPFTVILFHCFLLIVVVSNCALLKMWLLEERSQP